MKSFATYICKFVISVSILFTSIIPVIAQIQSLEIIGTAENNMEPVANAKVTVYKDGEKVHSLTTESNGEFRLALEINKEYIIQIEKAGFLSKKIGFNTNVPATIEGKWTMEFAMSLFPGCEGVDASVLNEPVDRIKFSTNKEDFISDEVYVSKIRSRIDKLLLDIDQCNAEKFQDAMREGNNFAAQKKYEEARASFQKALEINPDDKTVQRKIEELDKASGQDKKNEQIYNSAIVEADRLYSAKEYEAARTKYAEALRAMPQNSYPKSKISEINTIVQQQQQQYSAKVEADKNYNNLIIQANSAFAAKNYEAAKEFYRQASLIKPENPLPGQKIAELESLIAEQKKTNEQKNLNDKAYAEAMANGQNALLKNDYQTAREYFERASSLRPDQSLPQQKINEINEKVKAEQSAQRQADKALQQQKLTQALDQGDDLMSQKDYAKAVEAYNQAVELDPTDAYAKQQLNKAKSMLAANTAQKQQQLEKEYKESVADGDKLLAAASYQQAVEAYKQALLKKPDDIIVKNRLAEAEQKLAADQTKKQNEQSKKKQYDNLIVQGDNAFTTKQYDISRQAYKSASEIFPDQAYPRTRLSDIERLENEKQRTEKYNEFISKADGFLAAKSLDMAKSSYQQALTILPADTYAKQKIAEIDAIIKLNEKNVAEQKLRDAEYANIVREADNLLAQSKLPESKSAYQKALTIKPAETYPQQQISKVENLIAEQIKKENEKKSLDQQYANLILKADGYFANKDLSQARTLYTQASGLKSTESYPQKKISEIDGILRQQELDASQQKIRDDQYNVAIAEADNLFSKEKFTESKLAYQKALNIKPGQTYPVSQISKIDARISDLRDKENQYNTTISTADNLFNQSKYPEAKTSYQNAQLLKPDQTYPASQIAKIDAQLALKEKELQEKATFEQRYNSFIATADQSYDRRDYANAKAAYLQALNLKPSEKYPQDRLNKIAEFERIIAQQEANKKTVSTNNANASTTKSTAQAKLEQLKFANDSEREKYLKALRSKYPVGVTLEIYKEKNSTTYRYIVIRGDDVREFRKVQFTWGGVDFSDNGIPTTGQYFDTQVRTREGEFYQEFTF